MRREQPVVLVVTTGDFPKQALTEIIGYCGCDAAWLGPGIDWLLKLEHLAPDVVLADEDARYFKPLMDRNPGVPLLLAVQAGRGRSPVVQSIFCRLSKPLRYAQVVFAIEQALLYRKIAIDCWDDPGADMLELLGRSQSMRELYIAVDEAARREDNVLISGERGTGKRRLALGIRQSSSRWAGPVHLVDCRHLVQMDIEAELFEPLLREDSENAICGSTLFLGEVGTLSPSSQSRLLTALRERRVRLAATAGEIPLDVRIVAGTGEPLEKLAEEERFLPELLELLGQHRLTIPPLRDRKDDVSFLARRVVASVAADPGSAAPVLSAPAEELMQSYNWPGNAHELRSVVANAAVLSRGVITPADIDVPHGPARRFRPKRTQSALAEEVNRLCESQRDGETAPSTRTA